MNRSDTVIPYAGPTTAEVISLDGVPTIRVRAGELVVGYFTDPAEIPNLADVEIVAA
jgi:hypothetical protein